MKDAKFPWTEVIPAGSVQSSTQSYGADFGSRVLTIKIDWKYLVACIEHCVGYSMTAAAGSDLRNPVVFDANNPSQQATNGGWILLRQLPARHPAMPNLRATKIISIQGRGLRNNTDEVGTPTGGKVASGIGYHGNWLYAEISILFEIPKYPMLTEEEMTILPGGAIGGAGRKPEYLRFVEWFFETNVETLSRKDATWTFALQAAFERQHTFGGNTLLRQPKGKLTAKWYDVHQDFVMLGRLIPTNFFTRNSTLNARAFPQEAYRDQNKAIGPLNYVRFKPGTLLLIPLKTTAHAQCHPAVLRGEIDPNYFPRTIDLEISWIVFDPVTSDTTSIDLSAARYGTSNLEGNQFGGPNATLIRGHNLAPLVRPLNGFSYYTVVNNRAGQISSATNANPTVLTSIGHGLPIGAQVTLVIEGFSWTNANFALDGTFVVTVIDVNRFSINNVDTTTYGRYPRSSRLATWRATNLAFTDANLLYSYSDHEKLFAAVESL